MTRLVIHAQQAAERCLKGFLIAHEVEGTPRTHILEDLARRADRLLPLGLSLTELSFYAVEVRYDLNLWPDQETAKQEVEIAERVKMAVLEQIPEEAHPRGTTPAPLPPAWPAARRSPRRRGAPRP